MTLPRREKKSLGWDWKQSRNALCGSSSLWWETPGDFVPYGKLRSRGSWRIKKRRRKKRRRRKVKKRRRRMEKRGEEEKKERKEERKDEEGHGRRRKWGRERERGGGGTEIRGGERAEPRSVQRN